MKVQRESYLQSLIEHQSSPLITVVTGLRRTGKSYLLFKLFSEHLLKTGIDANHIIELDLDDYGNAELRDSRTCYNFVKEQVRDSDDYYLLIDEVQYLDEFADVINGLNKIENLHVVATGSNSRFLSTDVATEFRGRADVIHLHPFNFREFTSFKDKDFSSLWADYYNYGGLPLVSLSDKRETKINMLQSLIQTIYLRDIADHYALRGEGRMLELMRVLASSVGSLSSVSKIANTFSSKAKDSISRSTVLRYLQILEESFLIERADQFDLKGRMLIDAPSKYYFADTGLRNALLGFGGLGQIEPNHLMENIIFNELRIRGYQVKVGMVRDGAQKREIDFVAEKAGEVLYLQSAWSLPTEAKVNQELASLRAMNDSRRKIVVCADPIASWQNPEGIFFMSLPDFLNSETL